MKWGYYKKLLKLISPQVAVGGLEISDTALVYVVISPENDSVKNISLSLATGIVEGGIIKDRELFIKALDELHQMIAGRKEKILPVIVSISDANVFTQSFAMPPVKEGNKEEVIRLNLETISPIDFLKSYADVQPLGSSTEYLASFIEKEKVDMLYQACLSASFEVVAIEQRAASVVKTLAALVDNFDATQPHLVVHITGDGLSFSIMRSGGLYFNRFVSWKTVRAEADGDKREISFKEFRRIITQETHLVTNYYANRFTQAIEQASILAPGLEAQVQKVLAENFSFRVEAPIFKKYPLDASWAASLGAAIRGLIPRSKDAQISLAPEGTEERYFHSQITVFMGMWRNAIAASLFVLVVALWVSFIFLGSYENKLAQNLGALSLNQNSSQLAALTAQAEEFNKNVNNALLARQNQTHWSTVLRAIFGNTQGVRITRLYVQSAQIPILVNGQAASPNEAVAFKNRLEQSASITNADLPLVDIKPVNSTTVGFRISFSLKK